ncbi:hypothetical protein ACFL5G_03815 [Candidatus Margulisiibacteriota bacterium]
MQEFDKLSGKEKAMIFLSALGDHASAKVLKCLPEKVSKKIAEELNYFPKPNKEMIAHVFKELSKLTLKAGPDEAARMSREIESQLERDATKPELPVNSLDKLDPGELLHRLQNEQVQTIAFVLGFLNTSSRESFYQLLSPGRRKEISGLVVADIKAKEKIKEQIQLVLMAPQT